MLAAPAAGQETTGAIEGVVNDSGGAVLPGVTVQATGPAGTVNTVTNERGEYRFPRLPSGVYTVNASLSGFSTRERTVDLTVGTTQRAEFTLVGAGVTETVQVTAAAVGVDLTSRRPRPTFRASGSSCSRAAVTSPTSSARRPARRRSRRRAAFRSTAHPAPRTASSSTASTRPARRWAPAPCRCARISWKKCRSSRPATPRSSAARPAASSTPSPAAAPTGSAAACSPSSRSAAGAARSGRSWSTA